MTSGDNSRPQDWPLECKVYVGGLPSDVSPGELEDVFSRYGTLRKVWVARRPPGFAFLEFEDQRDAEDAVRALDGTRVCGVRVRVEMSSGKKRTDRGGGGGGGRDRDYDRDRRRTPPRRRSPRYSRSPRGRSRSRSPVRRSYSRSPPPRRHRSRSRS